MILAVALQREDNLEVQVDNSISEQSANDDKLVDAGGAQNMDYGKLL